MSFVYGCVAVPDRCASLALSALFGALSALSVDYLMLSACRVCGGVGIGGTVPTGEAARLPRSHPLSLGPRATTVPWRELARRGLGLEHAHGRLASWLPSVAAPRALLPAVRA